MVGREIEETDARFQPRRPARSCSKCESFRFPGPATRGPGDCEDISFSLRRGEILGIAGLMGAGRTELLECLFGAAAETPRAASCWHGREVRFRHPAEASRRGVALVTEDRKRLGLFRPYERRRQYQRLHARAKPRRWRLEPPPRRSRRPRTSVKRLGVKTAGVRRGDHRLSGGNQQKAIIGRWLLTQPQVLLLDDPDARHRRRRQSRALPADGPALPRGTWRSSSRQQRTARAAHGQRPDFGALRRSQDRRVRPSRRERTADHGSRHATRRVLIEIWRFAASDRVTSVFLGEMAPPSGLSVAIGRTGRSIISANCHRAARRVAERSSFDCEKKTPKL